MSDAPRSELLRLELVNKLKHDGVVRFVQERHRYMVNGVQAKRSVTDLVRTVVPPSEAFNADLIIKKYLSSWRSNREHKYHQCTLNKNDVDAANAIKREWARANTLGTAMHRALELRLNSDDGERVCDEVSKEVDQVERLFMQGGPCAHWRPHRTELKLFDLDQEAGTPYIAGTADGLFKDERDQFQLVDFKRTDKDLSAEACSFGKVCVGVLAGRPLNDHIKYSLQLHLYKHLFEAMGYGTIESCWIVQAHTDLMDAVKLPTTNLAKEAGALLQLARSGQV